MWYGACVHVGVACPSYLLMLMLTAKLFVWDVGWRVP